VGNRKTESQHPDIAVFHVSVQPTGRSGPERRHPRGCFESGSHSRFGTGSRGVAPPGNFLPSGCNEL